MYLYTYIPKYNLLIPYNIACVYVSRSNHLILDNQLCVLSCGENISCSYLYSVLFMSFVELRLRGIFSICFGMFIDVLWFSSYLIGNVHDILWVFLLFVLLEIIAQQTSWLSGSVSLSITFSYMFSEFWVWEPFVDVSVETELNNTPCKFLLNCVTEK